MSVRDVSTLLAVLAALPTWGFVALYALRAPWWRTPIGRNLMAVSTAVAVALTLVVLGRLGLRFWAGYQFLAMALYLVVGVLMWHRFILLLRTLRTPAMLAGSETRGP